MKKQSEYQAKYDAVNTKRYAIKLNVKNDGDIIAKLNSVDNVQGYIKEAIRRDIEASDKK